jgi:hypothetical protein
MHYGIGQCFYIANLYGIAFTASGVEILGGRAAGHRRANGKTSVL